MPSVWFLTARPTTHDGSIYSNERGMKALGDVPFDGDAMELLQDCSNRSLKARLSGLPEASQGTSPSAATISMRVGTL